MLRWSGREALGIFDRQPLAIRIAGIRPVLLEVVIVLLGNARFDDRRRPERQHAAQSLSCAMRMRATSRSIAGSLLRW